MSPCREPRGWARLRARDRREREAEARLDRALQALIDEGVVQERVDDEGVPRYYTTAYLDKHGSELPPGGSRS